MESILVLGERAATHDELIAAFDCASAGCRLPLPHALLLRAESELLIGDYRKSVIDVCTAAEVSLSKAVKRSLETSSVPKDIVAGVLKQATGAVDLFRLFVITGARPQVSEGRVMDQLANPRNAAVHAGDRLTSERARKAIETARRIVADADALPQPEVARRTARSGKFD